MGIVGIFLITACATTPSVAPPQAIEQPQVPTTIGSKGPVRNILVLSGGMARAFAHLGVLSVLEKENIPISKIYGIELGGWISLLYAKSGSLNKVEWEMQKIQESAWGMDQSLFSGLFSVGAKSNELPQSELKEIAEKYYKESTLDVHTGTGLKFLACAFLQRVDASEVLCPTQGLIQEAAVGSVANQGWFESATWSERKVSSALFSTPQAFEQILRENQELGDFKLIYVDVFSLGTKTKPLADKKLDERQSRFVRQLGVKANEHAQWLKNLKNENVHVIQPDLRGVGWLDFSKKMDAVYRGRVSTQAVMGNLRKFLE